MTTTDVKTRWRLILGRDAEGPSGLEVSLENDHAELDAALGFLFDREYERQTGIHRDRTGGTAASMVSVPDWLSRVRRLFPRSTADEITRTALARYQLSEILTDEEFLETVTPNLDLLRALLAVKEVLPRHVLTMARRLIRSVVESLTQKLTVAVRRPFTGAIHRQQRSPLKIAKNFDARTTIRRNLRHYLPERKVLGIEQPFFHSRIHRQWPWDILLVVDQSGSMTDSLIFAAVTAGIFKALPALRTHLIVFDTAVVDLSEYAGDPVEVLMRCQLGGGTDIAGALRYAEQLVRQPRRTILVLITDFFEGGPPDELLRCAKRLTASGVTLLGLAALDSRAEPACHREIAARMAHAGAEIGAMTPDRLAEWVARRVRP